VKIYINGEFLDEEEARISVFDYGLLYGYGLFESLRSYNGRVFRIDRHIRRLFDSAKEIGLNLSFSESELKDAVNETLDENNLSDAYIRVTVTYGRGEPRLKFSSEVGNTVIVFARELSLDSSIYERGIRAAISGTVRPAQFPWIKSLNFLPYLMAKLEAIERGVDDVILTNANSTIAEASTSNIFFISKGRLLTPPENSGILPGITREAVIEIAGRNGIQVDERRILPNEIKFFEECFLTNSITEIVPVVEIDGNSVGSGSPGEVTRRIHHLYRRLVADESL